MASEQHAAICRWLLNKKLDTMANQDIIKCSGAMANAKTLRNLAVRKLNLDERDIATPHAMYADPSRMIDASFPPPDDAAPRRASHDANTVDDLE